MKVLVTANVLSEEGVCNPGDILDLSPDIAKKWLTEGWALPAPKDAEVKVEVAAHGGSPQTATGRRQRPQT